MEDTQLLCRYIDDRSEEAFTELVRRHIDMVYFAALRRVGGDQHLAHDVTQSVFADLACKAASLKNRTVLAGWLYTSTRFAAAQVMRAEQRRRTHEQEAHTMNELNSAPEPGWDQLRPIIDEAMDQLSEHEREAVLLRFFENLPLAEVGAKFSVSPDAARMRVDRALEKLRGLLAKRGIASTSVALASIFAGQSGLAAPSGLAARIVAGSLSQAGTLTTTAFRLGKILTGVAIAALGTGFILYEANHRHPPAASSRPASQMTSAGRNPTAPAEPAVTSPGRPKMPRGYVNAQPNITATEIEFLRRMNLDPVYRASVIALAKSRLDLFYQPLFKTLNLSAARLDQFKDLLVEQQMVWVDVNEAVEATGIRQEVIDPAEFNKLFSQSMRDTIQSVDNEIKAFLTAPEYAQFVDYAGDLRAWVAVTALARNLPSTAAPLTDEQANEMVMLLRGSRPRPPIPTSFAITFGSGLFGTLAANPITPQVFEQAGAVLSAPQMEALRQVQQEWGWKGVLGY